MTRAVNLANLADSTILAVDGVHNRVGVGSTQPSTNLDVVGNIHASGNLTVDGTIPASQLSGALPAIDGANLTGVSGFATALSTDQSSPLNVFFKTPQQITIGAGTSLTIESDATSGNTAFVREGIIHVAVGATFHVGSATTLVTNVLGVF